MADSKKDVKVKISGEDGTKPAFDSAEKHAKGFGASVKSIVEGIGLAKLFEKVGEKVTEFFHGIAEEGMAAERTQKQLATTFRNAGADVAASMALAEEAVGKVARASGQADDEVAAALNNMVLKSGDVHASLAALPIVADLAAGANISLAEASDVVGKALAGQTKGLKQFGIVTTDAHAGLDILAKRFHGAAATDLSTFSGAMRAAENATKEAQEELGLAIIQTPYFQQGVRAMTKEIGKFADWIEKNRAQIGYWASVTVQAIKFVGTEIIDFAEVIGSGMAAGVASVMLFAAQTWNAVVEAAAKYDDFMAKHALTEAARAKYAADAKTNRQKLLNTKSLEIDKQHAIDAAAAARHDMAKQWDEMQDVVQAGARETAETVGHTAGKIAKHATEEEIKGAQAALDKFNADVAKASKGFLDHRADFVQQNVSDRGDIKNDPNKGPLAGDLGMGHGIDLGDVTAGIPSGKVDVPFAGKVAASIESANGKVDDLKDNLADLAGNSVMQLGSAFSSAFEDIGSGAESMGQALQKAGKAAIAGLAKTEGQYFQAKAAAGFAKGIGGNPAGFLEAAEWELAAAGMYAIAGAVGGGGHRGGGGGGGSSPAIYDDTATNRVGTSSQPAAGTLAAPRGAVNVTLVGPNDPKAARELIALINTGISNGHKVGG